MDVKTFITPPNGIMTWEEADKMAPADDPRIKVTEKASGSNYFRLIWFRDKDLTFPEHKHNFPHSFWVLAGSVRIRANDDAGERYKVIKAVDRYNPIEGTGRALINAETLHEITSLEDYTVCYCVFAHRNEHGEVVNTPESYKAYI